MYFLNNNIYAFSFPTVGSLKLPALVPPCRLPKSCLLSLVFTILIGGTPCKSQFKTFYSTIYRGLSELLHLIKATLEVRVTNGGSYLLADLAELLTSCFKVL